MCGGRHEREEDFRLRWLTMPACLAQASLPLRICLHEAPVYVVVRTRVPDFISGMWLPFCWPVFVLALSVCGFVEVAVVLISYSSVLLASSVSQALLFGLVLCTARYCLPT